MARRTSPKKPSPLPVLPENANWIENDRYDRYAYGQLRRDAASLQELERAGQALIPHFPSLLQDVFCLLFKYNIVFAEESDVLPSASVNRTLLTALRDGEVSRILRELTLLDEARAGLCTLLVGEGLLAMLKSEKPWTRHDMMDTWKLRQQEEDFQKTREMLEHAGELREDEDAADKEEALAEIEERLKSKLRSDAASIRQKQRQLTEDLDRVENEARARAQASAIRAAQQLEEAMEEAEQWGSAVGSGGRLPADRRLELGRRLAGNDKLKKLIRMVGRMKSHALALRKRTFERANEELYAVEQGRRPGAPAAAGAGCAAPPAAASGLSAPAAGERAAAVLAPGHGGEAQGAGGCMPRRQFVDVGGQGTLVQGRHPDPSGTDPAPAPAVPAPSVSPPGTRRCTSWT